MAKDNQDRENGNTKKGISRRDMLKGLATAPIVGGLLYGAVIKAGSDRAEKAVRGDILKEMNIDAGVSTPRMSFQPKNKLGGQKIRLGIIGFGIRGPQLVRASGFATKQWLQDMEKRGKDNARLKEFYDQEDLNIEYHGVCDAFTVRAAEAQDTVGKQAKIYKNWFDLINAPDIDAVIIATPDHWHAPIAIAAAKAGKHVYVEKPMTHQIDETHELYRTVKESGIKLQVGHQHRQTDSYFKAKELINKGVLGPVSMIITNTNRNSPNGAWVYPIHEKASPETIDWTMFLGNAPSIPFDKDRFFRWRKYWDYGTGLNGDLMTHEYDAMNQIMGLGIPKTAVCSGGVYFYKDGREVPDVMNLSLEFPDRGFTFVYSATLANEYSRTNVIMGHDATMEIGSGLVIKPDRRSTIYADAMEKGLIQPDQGLFTYTPGSETVDAVTSATERYFASKGLLYTYRNGHQVDSAHLHIKEWLESIRGNTVPSCDIEAGFEEAITSHMTTISQKMGITTYWDAATKEIKDATGKVIPAIPMGGTA